MILLGSIGPIAKSFVDLSQFLFYFFFIALPRFFFLYFVRFVRFSLLGLSFVDFFLLRSFGLVGLAAVGFAALEGVEFVF